MITFERAEKAMEYLRDNASRYGYLVGRCKALEQERKVVFGLALIEAKQTSRTIAEAEAKAYASADFKAVCEEIENAWAEKAEIETMIAYSQNIVDCWRSLFSKGHQVDRAHE